MSLGTGSLRYEGEIIDPKERFSDMSVHKRGNLRKNSWVYRATDNETGNRVAIKELTGSFNPTDMQGTRHAEKELDSLVRAYSMLDHPGLMQVLGYYWEDNGKGIMVPNVVMEFVEGETVNDQIERGYSPTQEDLVKLFFGAGSVIEYMHTSRSQPVNHRDIKPDNIMKTNSDSSWPFKIIDLSESTVGNATMSGSVLGTLGYRPPEQQWGEVNATTDWYGLLKTLEHCIMLDNFGNKDLSKENAPGVTENLVEVIRRGTSWEIEDRYSGFVEMARDMGYNIDRVPQTREELESILGNRSALVVQTPGSNAVTRTGETAGNGDGKVIKQKKGDGTYESFGLDFFSMIKGDVGLNAGLFAEVGGNAGLNAGLVSYVGGDVEVNIGGMVSSVGGNAGLNVGGIVAEVNGNAGVNIAGLVSYVGGSKDMTLKELAGRFGKYLPRFLEDVSVPSINMGAVTITGNTDNTLIVGAYNEVRETDGDYIAIGLLNRVKTRSGKRLFIPGIALRVTLDGILRHGGKNLEEAGLYSTEEEKGLERSGGLESLTMKKVAGVGGGAVAAVGVAVAGSELLRVGGAVSGAGLGVGGGAVLAGLVANIIGLSNEERFYHVKKGAAYGAIGVGASFFQGLFLDIPPEQKLLLGAGIQSVSTLIEPAWIIGKHYLAKRRERKLVEGGKENE